MNLTTPNLTKAGPLLLEMVETVDYSNWQVANHIGNLLTLGNDTIGIPMLFYGFWHVAKKCWQAANST